MRIKYFNKDMPRLKKLEKGDWIDLSTDIVCVVPNASSCIKEALERKDHANHLMNRGFENAMNLSISNDGKMLYRAGEIIIVYFGMAIELPEDYEAEIRVRSSLFRDTGLLLTNAPGTIDNVFCGDNDEWKGVFYATRSGSISRHQRICQFKIVKKQPAWEFEEVESFGNDDRGGFGSTGKEAIE